MLLAGRRIIVTGGASGIGAATALAYVREGARVAVLDIDDAGGQRVAAEAGAAACYEPCDVADRAAVLGAIDRAVAWLGGVERAAPAEEITEADWDLVLGVNAKGTLFTNQAAFRHLRARGGRIINFGSAAALRGQRGGAHYAAAKAAVLAWTRTAAQEWARYGITVNAI